MENKIKHLEFIQNVITRMNTNSFMIKGWAITLISALFALAAKDANRLYALVAYIPLPMFWLLDAFFLSQEKQYRGLYDQVRNINKDNIDFSMDARNFNNNGNTWSAAFFSNTLLVFYSFLVIVTLVVMFLIK